LAIFLLLVVVLLVVIGNLLVHEIVRQARLERGAAPPRVPLKRASLMMGLSQASLGRLVQKINGKPTQVPRYEEAGSFENHALCVHVWRAAWALIVVCRTLMMGLTKRRVRPARLGRTNQKIKNPQTAKLVTTTRQVLCFDITIHHDVM
jgi:hypothetical protein